LLPPSRLRGIPFPASDVKAEADEISQMTGKVEGKKKKEKMPLYPLYIPPKPAR
jgi:hypothetical protein